MKAKVTTKMVRMALKKNDLKIQKECWYIRKALDRENSTEELDVYLQGEACALGAICVARLGEGATYYEVEEYARRKFGVSYTEGFISGFDKPSWKPGKLYNKETGRALTTQEKKSWMQGFREGRRVRKAVL